MELKAVVLAGGRGSRMVDLTCQIPKCLLPVGGRPLLWYPLRMLQDAGIDTALVVVTDQMMRDHKNDLNQLPKQYGLQMTVKPVTVPGRDDPGTADSLRYLCSHHQLRPTQPLLVVSCDLVTACPLHQLLNAHQLRGAALTALFAAPDAAAAAPEIVTVPGPKTRHKPEHDLVGLTEPGPRLCLLASEADFEEEVKMRLAVLRRHPRLRIHRDLLDAHLYLLEPGMLEFIDKSLSLSSLKGEVVPQVIRAQYRRPRQPPATEPPSPPPAAAHSANFFIRPPRFPELTSQFASPAEIEDAGRASCFAVTTRALTWRANTTAAYLAANRSVTKVWDSLPGDRPPRIHPQADVSASKVRISEDSVVGEGSRLSEKTTLQRTVIGRNCAVGTCVTLTDCVLMDSVKVGDGCSLANCVLMNDSSLAADCVLKDCLVGVRQQVEAGAKMSRKIVSEKESKMEVY